MTSTVGTRELKTHLGRYLRLVRAGRRLVVTDRGRPVAEIRPVAKEADDESALLRDLAAAGKVTLGSGGPFPPIRTVSMRGRGLSASVSEDREERI